MTKEQVLQRRGGRREGAGRPATNRTERVNIKISPEALAILDARTNNRSEYIDRLIKQESK